MSDTADCTRKGATNLFSPFLENQLVRLAFKLSRLNFYIYVYTVCVCVYAYCSYREIYSSAVIFNWMFKIFPEKSLSECTHQKISS